MSAPLIVVAVVSMLIGVAMAIGYAWVRSINDRVRLLEQHIYPAREQAKAWAPPGQRLEDRHD